MSILFGITVLNGARKNPLGYNSNNNNNLLLLLLLLLLLFQADFR
jgi:hypothetical protein